MAAPLSCTRKNIFENSSWNMVGMVQCGRSLDICALDMITVWNTVFRKRMFVNYNDALELEILHRSTKLSLSEDTEGKDLKKKRSIRALNHVP